MLNRPPFFKHIVEVIFPLQLSCLTSSPSFASISKPKMLDIAKLTFINVFESPFSLANKLILSFMISIRCWTLIQSFFTFYIPETVLKFLSSSPEFGLPTSMLKIDARYHLILSSFSSLTISNSRSCPILA